MGWWNKSETINHELFYEMRDTLIHREPDGYGSYFSLDNNFDVKSYTKAMAMGEFDTDELKKLFNLNFILSYQKILRNSTKNITTNLYSLSIFFS